MDTKTIGPRFVQLKSQDTDPTAMSLQNRRFAPDGETYTHAWLARYCTDGFAQMRETATATEHSHSRMYSHDEWRNMRLKCKWCSIEGQCLSFTDVDPYGSLCDRCYDAARPPRFSYVDMVLRQFLGTVPEVCTLVAEYAYTSCADFLDWQKHMWNHGYVPEIIS